MQKRQTGQRCHDSAHQKRKDSFQLHQQIECKHDNGEPCKCNSPCHLRNVVCPALEPQQSSLLRQNDQANPVAASEHPYQKPNSATRVQRLVSRPASERVKGSLFPNSRRHCLSRQASLFAIADIEHQVDKAQHTHPISIRLCPS